MVSASHLKRLDRGRTVSWTHAKPSTNSQRCCNFACKYWSKITVDDRGLIDFAGEDIAGHVAEHDFTYSKPVIVQPETVLSQASVSNRARCEFTQGECDRQTIPTCGAFCRPSALSAQRRDATGDGKRLIWFAVRAVKPPGT
jgi:hypothetical protein